MQRRGQSLTANAKGNLQANRKNQSQGFNNNQSEGKKAVQWSLRSRTQGERKLILTPRGPLLTQNSETTAKTVVTPIKRKPPYRPRFISEQDPYIAKGLKWQLAQQYIARRCREENRESLSHFYLGLMRSQTPDLGRCLSIRHSRSKRVGSIHPVEISIQQPRHLPDIIPQSRNVHRMYQSQAELSNELEQKQPEESNDDLKRIEDIRSVRLKDDNFLLTNRQSYVDLQLLRKQHYCRPFENKVPFLSLNRKLMGQQTKFSTLKIYSIIATHSQS